MLNPNRELLLAREKAERVEAFKEYQAKIEYELFQYWRPHMGQAPIINAIFREWNRYVFLQCGRKLGKTATAIFSMYLWAILFPGSEIYFLADTKIHAGELVWHNGRLPRYFLKSRMLANETEEAFEHRREVGRILHDKHILKVNNSEMRLYFKNGSFIKVEGTDNYANADGIEPDFIVYDEFKHHDPRFHEAMDPNLRVKKAPLLILGTPPDKQGTYYEKIAMQIRRLSYGKFFKMPSYLNPVLYPNGKEDPEFLEEYNKYLPHDEDVAQRELLAEIVLSGSKSIFPTLQLPEYDYGKEGYIGESVHVRPHEELIAKIKKYPKDYEYYSVFDPGSVVCFANLIMVFNKYTKEVYLIDEIYETDQAHTSTMDIFPRSIEKMEEINPYWGDWELVYDNAAAWFLNEVQYNFEGWSLMPCTKDMGNKEAKLGQIKDMMKADLLLVSDKCQKFLWEAVGYRKTDNGKIPKENDHLIDCLRYGINAMMYDFNENLKPKKTKKDNRGMTVEYVPQIEYSTGEDGRFKEIVPREVYE